MLGRGEKARQLLSRIVVEKDRLMREHKNDYLRAAYALAKVNESEGDIPQAIQRCEELLRLSPGNGSYNTRQIFLRLKSFLAFLYYKGGRSYEGLELIKQCLELQIDSLGFHHADTAASRFILGDILLDKGEHGVAVEEYHISITS
jgi:tetratricopeptide (TPR) repeat protein